MKLLSGDRFISVIDGTSLESLAPEYLAVSITERGEKFQKRRSEI
jgi:hypothetical protein